MLSLSLVALAAPACVYAAVAQTFKPDVSQVGPSNSTIVNSPVVAGKSFDRFVQIWLENTDFATAASSPVFQSLAKQGVLFNGYAGVTHPSEPNYIASVSGDFFGLSDDAFHALPSNVSTIVDLLEAKNVSWSSYQESMPYDGYTGFNYTTANYLNTSAPGYTYYVRKHNPLIMHNSVAGVASRALRIRNFNDLTADLNASALSQWTYITPNLVNDAHDTNVDFTSAWLTSFLVPLLANKNFNDNRTLILLTFDENENYAINNNVYTLALGGAIPASLLGTTDDTYYTHYSALSTVEANWGLGSLGRGDTNKTLSNVFSWVANATGYVNNGLKANSSNLPLTNLTGIFPGPLSETRWTPALAPNVTAVGAGGGPVFVYPGMNLALNTTSPPAPVNLTAVGQKSPSDVNPGYDYSSGTLSMVSAALPTATGTNGTAATKTGAAVSVNAGRSVVLSLVAVVALLV